MSRGARSIKGAVRKIKVSSLDWRVWIAITLSLVVIAGSLMAYGVSKVLKQTQQGTDAAVVSSIEAKKAAEQATIASEQASALTTLAKQLTDPNNPANREAVRQRQELLASINSAVDSLNIMSQDNEEFKVYIKALLNQIIVVLNES